jgi:non-heme chloroperoxidase
VLAVMNQLGLRKVLLVGHSIAGEELTWLGGHQGERFTGLVYLDAAYDRASERGSARSSRLRQLNALRPAEPPLPPEAFLDLEAAGKLLQERGHLRYPEGELIAFLNADKPFAAGTPNIDGRAQQAILAAVRAPDYSKVKIPALAVYAFPDPDAPLPPWYDATDAKLLASLAEIRAIGDAMRRENLERFRRSVELGQVLELPKAQHYVIQSNAREVLAAIERFSGQIQGSP